MKIAEARKKTSTNWKTKEVTWEQFMQKLRTPMRTAETAQEYAAMGKAERDAAKEAAGGFVGGALSGPQRKTANVTERSMITLDADHAVKRAWENAVLLMDYKMCCYSTHSHTERNPRLRFILPTDRPMTPDEYPAVARRAAEWIGIDMMDPSTYEAARLMYYPTCPKDGAYVFREQEGPLLRVDEVLRTYGDKDAWKDCALWPTGAEEQALRSRAAKKAGEPREKPGLIGLFCRTYDVPSAIDAFLPEVYARADGADERYTYLAGSTAGGAVVYNGGDFLYSNHATDPCGGQSVNAFDLVRIHKFGELDDVNDAEDAPVTRLKSYKAMCAWCAELPEIKEQMVRERTESVENDFADLTGVTEERDAAETETPAAEDTSWQSGLELNSKTGECEPTVNNALLILRNDPSLKDCVGYDLFSGAPVLKKDVPWRKKGDSKNAVGKHSLWDDRDDAGLRWYMQRKWLYDSRNNLQDALELAMHTGEFHPVRDYLNGLAWDGEKRIDHLLNRCFGVEETPYTTAAGRKWMTAAVARVMHPGCKFDCVLVLAGEQGLGKSTFADILSRGWKNESEVDMNSKAGYEVLQGCWIVELAELDSVKRSEVTTVKTFISSTKDVYRAAYARRSAEHLRQCIFFGTTNEVEFLRDRTGARRFWPIPIENRMDFRWLRENVDQLWAEAVQNYKNGEYLDLDTQEQKDGWETVVQGHKVQDDLEGQLLEYLDTLLPENWEELTPESKRDYINGDSLIDRSVCTVQREQVCVMEIRVELLGEDRRKRGGNDLMSRRVANIMNNLPGWKKGKKVRVPGYGPQWVYRRVGDRTELPKAVENFLYAE